jgi:uncharacterized protein
VKLTHDFLVRLPVDEAWSVLTDVERIAPCMPGVRLDSAEGEVFGGRLTVKVGPITADYAGTARFVERDVEAWTVVLRAEGRETKGKGNAAATVTMELVPEAAGTRVAVATDLAISGRLAQFGRGVLGEVSNRLLDQFVQALEREVAGDRVPAAAAPRAHSVPVHTTNGAAPSNLAELDWPDDEQIAAPSAPAPAEPRSLDVLRVVAVPVGKRLLAGGAVIAAAVVLARRLRR